MSIISTISYKLLDLSAEDSNLPQNDVFSIPRRVNMNIELYLLHLQESLQIDEQVLVQAYNYIQRLTEKVPGFVLNLYNLPRVLLTSLLVANKYFHERPIQIQTYAEKGGIPCSELLRMEIVFLELIDWDLSISYDSFRIEPVQDDNSTADGFSSDEDFLFDSLQAEDNEEISELSVFFE